MQQWVISSFQKKRKPFLLTRSIPSASQTVVKQSPSVSTTMLSSAPTLPCSPNTRSFSTIRDTIISLSFSEDSLSISDVSSSVICLFVLDSRLTVEKTPRKVFISIQFKTRFFFFVKSLAVCFFAT